MAMVSAIRTPASAYYPSLDVSLAEAPLAKAKAAATEKKTAEFFHCWMQRKALADLFVLALILLEWAGHTSKEDHFSSWHKLFFVASALYGVLSLLLDQHYKSSCPSLIYVSCSRALATASVCLFPSQTIVPSVTERHRNREVFLNDGRRVMLFRTKGEGDCGFHGLFGKYSPEWGGFVCADVLSERRSFSTYLWQMYQEKRMPWRIQLVLHDYFLHMNNAPSQFRQAVAEYHRELSLSYPTLGSEVTGDKRRDIIDLQETIKQLFVDNEKVVRAYLQHLATPGSYLLQDELITLSETLGINLVLIQPDWNGSSPSLRAENFFSAEGLPVAVIYYNGHDHYFRAGFIRE